MTERNCTVDDCGAPIKARGLCMLHYGRAYRAGERARMPLGRHTIALLHKLAGLDGERFDVKRHRGSRGFAC